MGLFDMVAKKSEANAKNSSNIIEGLVGRNHEKLDVINYQNICQTFDTDKGKTTLFENFNLDIKDISGEGQFTTIIGSSGCGKTTLLNYLSGLNQPTSGDILLYGKKLTNKDRIPMVFQRYSSFPWKTVLENVSLPLILKGFKKSEAEERAMKIIKFVGLEGHEKKWGKYGELSGGQLQRVAIARNLVSNPQILLLDEPLSALDIRTRNDIQNMLLELFYNKDIDITFILVTHDIREAVYLSNTVIMLGNKPASVVKQYNIDLGHRTTDTKNSMDYIEWVKKIDNDFRTI